MIVNVSQNAAFSCQVHCDVMPALLTCSNAFDIKGNCEVPPALHWLIMGWGVPGLGEHSSGHRFPFPSIVGPGVASTLSDSDVKRLTGNAMHKPPRGHH